MEDFKMESTEDLELFHYGVLGMKWGVRRPVDSDGYVKGRAPGKSEHRAEKKAAKTLNKDKKRYDKTLRKKQFTIHNEVARKVNNEILPKLDKKYEKYDFSDLSDPKVKKVHEKYIREFNDTYAEVQNQTVKNIVGERPR